MNVVLDISDSQRGLLLHLLREYLPGVEVWAYGSRVKGTARPYSDLDLVAFATPEQSRTVPELREALAESNLPFPVDLHIWHELPESFHAAIHKEHVVAQQDDSG